MNRPKAIAEGILRFGDTEVDCYVLEDGRRLLSQRAILGALVGGAKTGNLERFLARLPNEFNNLTVGPRIEFVRHDGGSAIGRDRMFFVALCDAYADLWARGELHPKQERIARVALAIVRSLAKVGIDALIDEATGYQELRQNNYLRRLFEHTLRNETSGWEVRFPASLVSAMAPLWGIRYTGGSYPKELHRAFGLIYDIVLGREVSSELRRRNPAPRHRRNHHQWLQPSAQSLLANDLRLVEVLAGQSRTRKEFWNRMRAQFEGQPLQLGMQC